MRPGGPEKAEFEWNCEGLVLGRKKSWHHWQSENNYWIYDIAHSVWERRMMEVAAHGLRCERWPEADEEKGLIHKAERF